ncbi:heme o synthase [Eilatimonas milleporae]|uniref:Protoheme IX farnesyltransferase n=1 Tax=Eilatimonas milleporae TaxID=911205 RepID=A0A3M0C607_9PROT|nr:heme o synthase [Eilatimonas milleporae]RMB04662.1 protoheme IX farnesyltransferase [Eilatimonas milleporae]
MSDSATTMTGQTIAAPTARPGRDTISVADAVSVADARAFIELLKPRVMSLVIFTAFVGMMAAPGGLHPVLAMASLALIAVGAGASGALNMWYDADIDALMERTKARPVPSGRIAAGDALGFGLALSVMAVVLLGLIAGITAAALLALTIFFYAVVYTMWLKRRTPQNIVIGGAAGAFPPMIGWAAVTNSVTVESLVLFAIIFLWTPPHFWALSLFIENDYARVKVPMLPVVAGRRVTRNHIMAYSLVLVPVGVLPFVLGLGGVVYGAVSAALGLRFLWWAFRVWREHEGAERRLFRFSILYLFLLFATLLGETLVGGWL